MKIMVSQQFVADEEPEQAPGKACGHRDQRARLRLRSRPRNQGSGEKADADTPKQSFQHVVKASGDEQ